MNARPDARLAQRGGWIEILRAPASLFGAIARARSFMYSRRVLPSYQVDAVVISVGNIVAGGTGKTPMIVWLARELESRGRKVGIVSRGYRAPSSGTDDEDPSGSRNRNDEARMLHDMLPGVPHVQDRDRVAAAQRLTDAGVDVILVDDGFQHRRLSRDVDIVLVDALRPFGLPAPEPKGGRGGDPVEAFLPRGLLREPLSALKRANAVVLTRVDSVPKETLGYLEARLAAEAPGIPIGHSMHRAVGLRGGGDGGEGHLLTDLQGLEVDLFSGIGNPGAFEQTVRDLGAIVVSHRAFADHHNFAPSDLAGLGTERPALTTAKDAARLELQPEVKRPDRLMILDVELDLVRGADELRHILDTLPESTSARVRASIHEGLHG
jgi:tetraacyldisaccharide 4'-kinase